MTYDFSGLGFEHDEIAVVTGAGNGIGRSTALMLARAGVTVVGWDLDGAGLAAVADEIASSGGAFESAVGDLTDEAFVDDAWRRVAALGRPVPYLVNNAGPPSTTQMTVAEGVRIAIGSYATVAEGFVAHCGESASSMTFTASIAGNFYVGPTPDWYPAAKAGIAGLVRQLAVRLRGRPRCNGIAPAGIKTQRTAEMPQAVIDKIARRPLGRMGEPDEVATLICYLLSPAASFINGVLVPVDGAATWTD